MGGVGSKVGIYIGLVIFLISLLAIASSLSLNVFSTGISEENLSLSNYENITRNISLFKTAIVTSATLNLSAHVNILNPNLTSCEGFCGNFADNNWSTLEWQGSGNTTTYKNFSFDSIDLANFNATLNVKTRDGFQNIQGLFYCKNKTSGNFEHFYNRTPMSQTGSTPTTYTIPISNQDCFLSSPFQLLTKLNSEEPVQRNTYAYEENLSINLPYSPHLEIGIEDYTYEWNVSGYFNGTNIKTGDLSASINKALNNSCSGGTLEGDNCTIPFTFYSELTGVLEYSDLILEYETSPIVNLVSPLNGTSSTSLKVFECNATDLVNITNATLYVWNASGILNNSLVNLTSGLYNETSFTFSFDVSGTYFWNCLFMNNGTNSSFADENNTIYVSTTLPAITIHAPEDNFYQNEVNATFNCSSEGASLDSIMLYGDFNGSYEENQSIGSVVSGTVYSFNVTNLSDSNYTWNCAGNQTTGNFSYYPNNRTLIIDTLPPTLSFTSLTTTEGSQTASALANVTDLNINSSNCKYSIFNSTNGIDGLNNNVSFTCNNTFSPTVSAYGTYVLEIYATDLAGNENTTNQSFTTSESSGGGGGGGGSSPNSRVVALKQPSQDKNIRSSLDRAIIFARIRNYSLTHGVINTELYWASEISKLLSSQGVGAMDETLLGHWIQKYKDKQYEVVEVSEANAEKYDLVKAETIFGSPFSVVPAIINSYVFVRLCDFNDIGKNWSTKVKSTKIMTSCSANTEGYKCTVISPSTAQISYTFSDYNFTIANLEGEIEYVSIDDEIAFTQIKYLNVINVCGKVETPLGIKINLVVLSVIIVVIAGGLVFLGYLGYKKISRSKIRSLKKLSGYVGG